MVLVTSLGLHSWDLSRQWVVCQEQQLRLLILMTMGKNWDRGKRGLISSTSTMANTRSLCHVRTSASLSLARQDSNSQGVSSVAWSPINIWQASSLWAFTLHHFVTGAQRWQCLWSHFLTTRGFLDRDLKLNSMRGEKEKPFHQWWTFENLWFHQMFSLITVEDTVGDSEDGVAGVPCCAFRVQTKSEECVKSSSIPRRKQQ